jgi:DNA-binding response OmpR family regulator
MRQVLVIDDDPGIAHLVSWCLDPLGVVTVLASNLQTALDVARGNQDIGLVLLDFDLGDEDGLDILPHLRQEPNLEGVPVVAFTAHDSRRHEAFDRGVDSFIARPFANAELCTTVELHLTR